MRSGREHLAWILAVEVRQGTLGVDGRGWGPAGNTGRGYPRLRSGREHWRWWSWLRSGREHWAWMVVVEVRQRPLCVEGRSWAGGGEEERRWGEEEEQATDIKSNNPHLAGGEKKQHSQCICESVQWYAILLPLFAYHKTPFGTSQNRTGSSNGFLIGFSACYPLQGKFLSRFLPLQVTTVHGSWPSQYLKTIFCWFVLMPVSRLRNW